MVNVWITISAVSSAIGSAAAIAVLLRAPFLVIVGVAALTAALIRLLA